MARLLDRAKAEALLVKCRETSDAADDAKELWEAALIARADSWLAANEGGLLVQEIAIHVDRSVGLVKLEVGKAKARRTEAA